MSNVNTTKQKQSEGKPVTPAEQKQLDEYNQSQIVQPGITPESLREGVHATMAALAATLYEPELKVRGNNGKLYPHDASLPEGVEADGEEETNRFRYMQTRWLENFCYRAEADVEFTAAQVAKKRAEIASDVKRMNAMPETALAGAERMIENKAIYLEQLIEQHVIAEIIFDAALSGFELITGIAYETKAMKAERERKERLGVGKRAAPVSAFSDRLARLGVRA